jgi:hypothetical protein
MYWKGVRAIFVSFALTLVPILGAQAQENSPYSSFGIGDLSPREFAWSKGMGSISAALFDPGILNFVNPASYAYINKANFDVGIYGNLLNITDGTETVTTGNGSLSHLAFGFPLWKQRLGIGFGLLPFSRVQYNIRQEQIRDPQIGLEALDFQGNGTLYEAMMGLGYRTKGFSVGFNTGFLFGTIDNARFVSFIDTLVEGAYSTRALRSDRFRGLVFDAGIGYRVDLPNDLKLDFGATSRLNTRINGTENIEYITVVLSNNLQQLKDSVVSIDNGEADIRLPLDFSFGVTLRQGYRQVDDPLWRLGLEFQSTRWSGFEGIADNEPFTDSWKIKAGGEFTPADRPDNNSRPLDYRLGFQYGKGNLTFDGKAINEFGISFGFGIPVSYSSGAQRNSKINLSMEIGQRSSPSFYTETFYKGSISFTLNDSFWFLKSKVN